MKNISDLMGIREGIRVVDATLRDGGLVNDFRFTDEFAQKLYRTNIEAGIDCMEVGYKASKKLFDPDKFGLWKFCDDDKIARVLGPNDDDKIMLAAMADVGRCDYKDDIIDKANSPLDVIRVACYVNQIAGAVDMIEDAKKKGYTVTCNIMAISTAQEGDVRVALEMLGHSPVDVIYIVDSFGSLYPEQIARITALYKEYADKYSKKLGIHAHNNQQLAFANTIEALGDGADWLDGTYSGMGRGAGNCYIESLRNPKYSIYPVIRFVEEEIPKLRKAGAAWGYDLQYLVTGILNQHPRAAIAFTKDKRHDYSEFYKDMLSQD